MQYSSNVVDSIRQSIDIAQFIGECVPLKKSGSNFVGLCPFHNEKTASFSVSTTKQLFHCFGCKVGGDIFQFAKLYYRWEFTQAIEELAKRAGIILEKNTNVDPDWDEGLRILEFSNQLFRDTLMGEQGKSFRKYLESRKIPEPLWKSFQIGAHPGGMQFLSAALEKKGLDCELAVRLGLLGRSHRGELIDRFQGRLIFPIFDEKGRTRGFGARSLGDEQPKYINSPKTRHFDKSRLFYGMHLACHSIARKGYAVLVEGYLDVLALHEFGITNAIGSMGTALTLDQVRILKRWSHRVISLYDQDRAGISATERNLGNFFREGMEAKVVKLPNAKDPDAFAHSSGLNASQVKAQLKQAFNDSRPALDYLVENTILPEKNALARGQKLHALVDLLDQVPNEIERAVLKKDIAKRFDLPEALLFPDIKPERQKDLPESASKTAAAPLSKEEGRWERELLKFIVKWGEIKDLPLTEAVPYLSSSNQWGLAYLRALELKSNAKSLARLEGLEEADTNMLASLREWALEPQPEALESSDIERMWSDLVAGLRRSYYQRESERLQGEIARAEVEKDFDHARSLLLQKQDLIRLMKNV